MAATLEWTCRNVGAGPRAAPAKNTLAGQPDSRPALSPVSSVSVLVVAAHTQQQAQTGESSSEFAALTSPVGCRVH